MKICMVFNEKFMEDEYHLFLALSTCKVICEQYDDLLNGHGHGCHMQIPIEKDKHI